MIRLSIRRPVAVAMAYTAVALLGVAAWQNIPIEMFPDADLPQLSLSASWPGASPETVEAFLTSPLESTVQQMRGVEKIVSVSSEQQGRGSTQITVEFLRDTDMDFARLDLSERISQLEEELPEAVSQVSIAQYVPREFQSQEGQGILRYSFTGPYVLEALREHALEIIKPGLEQIDGVGEVQVYGGRDRELVVQLDESKVLALGLRPEVIRQRIRDLDLVREAGVIREGGQEWTLTIQNQAREPDDLRRAVLLSDEGRLVRVADVARVVDGYEDARNLSRIDGNPALLILVNKEPRTNTVRVADAVKERMTELESLNPFGSEIVEDYDQSVRIRAQLQDLRYRAAFAAVVIFLVLLLFLRSFWSAWVIFATIVFSILISLNLIYYGGLTLNLLTLMGLAMGFGLIVDNSIVVLENVFRRWQGGAAPEEAAEEGAKEVVLPIMAATATTLIVFVPFVYLQGELRVFYMPLAIVVGLTLLASLFVAFTFIPSLSAKLLASRERPTFAFAPSGQIRAPIYERIYRGLIGFTLRYPWVAVSVAVLSFGGSYYLFDNYVNRGIIWGGGRGGDETYVSINIRLPRGSDLERTDELAQFFEERLKQMPEVDQFRTDVGGTYAQIYVTFPEEIELTAIPVATKEQLVSYSLGFTGAEVRVYGTGPAFAYGGGSSPPNYAITVLGYNYEEVRRIAENLGSRLSRMARIQDVDTNSSANRFQRDKASEFVVDIDREALARYDMTVTELGQSLRAAIAGASVDGTVRVAGEDVDFAVKLRDVETMSVLELRETILTGPDGTGIRLGDVVQVYNRDVLANIRRENQQYERRVAYEFRGPRKLGDLIRDQVLASTDVPQGYSVTASEGWRWSIEQRNQVYFVLTVSILLIYMVTAALFESLRQPMVVLLTVPMALIGVFMIFFYINASFTREAYIGVIMMGGIVVNNAILLVDHINRVRRDTGLALKEAVLEGTLERVRPILMTTATTVLGLLPLVLFSTSADANIWNALTYALIGGLISSTIFVLTTTPALYLLFERGLEKRRGFTSGA